LGTKFLGFSFTNHKPPKRRLAAESVARFKERVREPHKRTRGEASSEMAHDERLSAAMDRLLSDDAETRKCSAKLEKWLRRRLRVDGPGAVETSNLRDIGSSASSGNRCAWRPLKRRSSDGPVAPCDHAIAENRLCPTLTRLSRTSRAHGYGYFDPPTAVWYPHVRREWQGRLGDHSPYADCPHPDF